MKRYAVFDINHYYPSGGMNDFYKSFDTLDDAINAWKTELMKDAKPLDEIIKDCSWSVEIWDMAEVVRVWDMREEYNKNTIS